MSMIENTWYDPPGQMPDTGRVVKSIIQNCATGEGDLVVLIAVDESDCLWRFTDDNSELSREWDVLCWTYIDA